MASNCIKYSLINASRYFILRRNFQFKPYIPNSNCNKKLLMPNVFASSFQSKSGDIVNMDLNYADLTESLKRKDVLLIDVRNPDEVKDGSIPGSFNVPLGELEGALQLDDKEFEAKYKHSKPPKNAEIIFSCRSGNRSRKALDLAQKLGFNKSKHYVGGWLDWVEQPKQ